MAFDSVAVTQLLNAMMSDQDSVRQPAESSWEAIDKSTRAAALFTIYKEPAPEDNLRSFCLVLLRRLLSSSWDETYQKWNPETQAAFRNDLLVVAKNETSKVLKKRIGDVLAETARNMIDEESGAQIWIEVMSFIVAAAQSDDQQMRFLAMEVFESVPGLLGVEQNKHLNDIKQMFRSCMQSSEEEVRTSAVKAYTMFVLDNEEDENVVKKFTDVIPDLLKVVRAAVEADDDDDTTMQCLVDLATTVPKALRSNLGIICQLCMNTASNSEKDDSIRHSALEVLVSLCESAPAMMRKAGNTVLSPLVDQCLTFMCDIEESEEWYVTDDVENEDDDDENATVGESSLDRIATAIGGKTIWPMVKERVKGLLISNEWQHKHAGIMAISCIGEGCRKAMEPSIEHIVETIVPFTNKEQHARVRYAACNALGQMSTDFAPTLEKKTHEKTLPALLSALGDTSTPRVAAHAGAAIVNFSEECPKHILALYLQPMMATIVGVLQDTYQKLTSQNAGKKYILEQVITTMAAVSDTAEDAFLPFYDQVMPFLKHILVNANSSELRLLRGKTIECMSLIGLAVGKDKFLPDANEIMQVLLASQEQLSNLEADDPQVSYMMAAWARICKLIGDNFAQYLPLVMPPVLKAAAFKPDITVCDTDDVDPNDEDQNGWQFVNMSDNQSFGIRTQGLEDKATALDMIETYVSTLKHLFVDYVEAVFEVTLPLTKFYFHDGVRSSAALILPALLQAYAPKGDAAVLNLFERMWEPLLNAARDDPEIDVQADYVSAIANCINTLGAAAIINNAARMEQVQELQKALFEAHFAKCAERDKQKQQDEDHDDEAAEELKAATENETEVIGRVSDIWHALFEKCGEFALPYFEQLLPLMLRMFEPGRTPTERQWILCIFDDLIEFTGGHSIKYQDYFLQPMINGLSDDAPEVRQAASYGFGIMAMKGENAYAQICAQVLPHLMQMVARDDARTTQENTIATDNAVAAVAKILKYNASMVDQNVVIPSYIQWLPTWEDKEEQAYIYDYYCGLVENNNVFVLADLARVMYILVNALRRGAFDASNDQSGELAHQTQQRCINIIAHLKNDASIFQQCAMALEDEDRNYLAQLVEKI